MIKISVEATAVRLIVDEVATLKLKIGNDTYVDFPIYDESFPLVKAGKKFRLTLEEMEMNELDGPIHDELMPMSDEEVSEFIKTRSEYPEELAQEYQGSFDKGPFCDGCKHIGVNPESDPCDVCFEGSRYDDSHKAVLPIGKDDTAVANSDEEFKVPEYLIHQRVEIPAEQILHKDEKPLETMSLKRKAKTNNATCKRCANKSRIPVCQECVDFGNFKDIFE